MTPGGAPGRWPSWAARRAALPAVAAGLAVYLAMLGYAASYSQGAPRNVGLTAWLTSHHLRDGLAPYWESASVTVDSGGAVTMVAVEPSRHGYLVPRPWQADVLSARPGGGRSANFVVLSPAENVQARGILATFGKPAAKYRWGPFAIWVWHRNLLVPLAHPPKPSPGHTAGPVRAAKPAPLAAVADAPGR